MHRQIVTFFLHSGSKALGKTTVATLVTLVLVNQTVPAEATRVNLILAHTPTEKSLSSVNNEPELIIKS
jgi:hypothetical protein